MILAIVIPLALIFLMFKLAVLFSSQQSNDSIQNDATSSANNNIICKSEVYLTDKDVLRQLQTTFPVKFTIDNSKIESIKIKAANNEEESCSMALSINKIMCGTTSNYVTAYIKQSDIDAIQKVTNICRTL